MHIFRKLLEQVSLEDKKKQKIEDVLRELEAESLRKDFILEKLVESKKTTEAFLNKVVEELELKNKELSDIALESQKVNEQLVSTNQELEQFAFIISHDLQEPLRTIMSFTELLFRRKQEQLDEQTKIYLRFITQSSSRLSHLIKAILEYSRIGKTGSMSDIDCSNLIGNVLLELDVPIKDSQAIISVDKMPVIHGFRNEIHSLFQNLISNAIKYSKENTVPQIKIECEAEEEFWVFSVRDNGIGIKNDYLERIFVIFQRLNIF